MLVKFKLLNESASNKTTFWKARSVEEEHSSIKTTRGNMVHFPRTPQQMSLPAVASEAETMATPQQASSSYPRPEPPEPPITVPLVLNTTTTHTYSRPLNP